NADFAEAVEAAGVVWVGPSPEALRAGGDKLAAKRFAREAGVPVLPEGEPGELGFPLLVKAAAGGGGRGMRVVRTPAELDDALEAARREANAAFGDETVFCERYLERPRHVEIQLLGDGAKAIALGERECSVQRRHQKVLEESPSPALDAELHEGARLAAQAIAYVGAGTVEFMVSGDRVSFLEMNTRLQVEHPVTEAVFGIDLVEAQIRVAEGGTVPDAPSHPRGHAVEVRLYAEDPAADYQPQSGRLDTFEVPADGGFEQLPIYGTRLHSGFVSGSEVSTHYDAMLAKVIAWGPDRTSAFRTLAGLLERSRIHGLVTNRDLLVRLLRDERVLAGEVSTDFLAGYDLAGEPADQTGAAVAAAIALAERDRAARVVQRQIPVAWRNVVSQPQRTELAPAGGDPVTVEWSGGRTGYQVDGFEVVAASVDQVVLVAGGVQTTYRIAGSDDVVHVDSGHGSASYHAVPRFVDPAEQVSAGSLLAPMPGTVIAVQAENGSAVEAGQTLLVLEAMKMQHSISAPGDGVVEIAVSVGQQVAAGDVLAVVSPSTTPDDEESA
ncbi:MAG: biotin/lipoyl-containing protein, partial [Marmoricola sp.]